MYLERNARFSPRTHHTVAVPAYLSLVTRYLSLSIMPTMFLCMVDLQSTFSLNVVLIEDNVLPLWVTMVELKSRSN